MPFKVDLAIEHNEDWTMLTEKFNVTVQTLDYSVGRLNNKNINIEMSNVCCSLGVGRDKDNILNFIDKIKRYKNVFKVAILDKYRDKSGQGRNIITIEDYRLSIRKLVDEKMGFFTSTRAFGNTEYYTIFFPFAKYKTILDLREELRDEGNILSFKIFRNAELPLNVNPYLTRREVEALRNGWRGGYFNYPKGIKLEKLSSELGITRSTLNFHIRNGVRKSIKYLLDNGIYNWQA